LHRKKKLASYVSAVYSSKSSAKGIREKRVRTPDHLKNHQYLSYVMDNTLRLKNRADLSSCRLLGLQKHMGC